MIYGKVLKEIRESMGISQEELSNRTGLKQPLISMIENGVQQPSRDYLELIAYELEVPLFVIVYLSTSVNDINKDMLDLFCKTKSKMDEVKKTFGLKHIDINLQSN
jgi:transcriptional regulator with XRE-family HTH domain